MKEIGVGRVIRVDRTEREEEGEEKKTMIDAQDMKEEEKENAAAEGNEGGVSELNGGTSVESNSSSAIEIEPAFLEARKGYCDICGAGDSTDENPVRTDIHYVVFKTSTVSLSLSLHMSDATLPVAPPALSPMGRLRFPPHAHTHVAPQIVFCDGCDISVHQGCFGNPLAREIPEGDWMCERCKWNASESKCSLCPLRTGAMKRTVDWQWVHVACALWIPEVFCHHGEGLDAINTFHIPKRRFEMKCDYCHKIEGAGVRCSYKGCQKQFHISCGLRQRVPVMCEMKEEGPGRPALVLTFCSDHAAAARSMVGKKMKYFSSGGGSGVGRSKKKRTRQGNKKAVGS